jgi:hypothetical protein
MFCIRILILRLSPKTLSQLFRNIWPMLLTFLMQVFSQGETLNANLLLSTLKLIELISIVAMEEFHVYQWIFVFDYFGLKFEAAEHKT